MKNSISYIDYNNEKIPICFNLNVMEELQEKYGTLTKWFDAIEPKESKEPNIKELKTGLIVMINEAVDAENENREEKMQEMTSKKIRTCYFRSWIGKICKSYKENSC